MPNPWLGLWLSAANRWAGAARGLWVAELHRQQAALVNENEMVRQTMRVWAASLTPPAGPRR
jgi:hypothetical protein